VPTCSSPSPQSPTTASRSPPRRRSKKANGHLALELEENPDILAWVAGLPKPPFCVGFAAESENLAENAKAKLAKKKLPLIAANLAQEAIGRDDSAITLFDAKGEHPSGAAPRSTSHASWSSTSPQGCRAANEEAASQDPRREDPPHAAALRERGGRRPGSAGLHRKGNRPECGR
jgi:hypothetical protein